MVGPISPVGGINPSFGDDPSVKAEAEKDLEDIMGWMSDKNWQAHWPEIEKAVADLRQNCVGHLPGPANRAVCLVVNMFPSHMDPTEPPHFTASKEAQLLDNIIGAMKQLHS